MKEHPLLERVRLVRRDVGNLLFHFTRAQASKPAAEVLAAILKEGVLRAGNLHVRGGYRCICFTEAPITELVATFSLVNFASTKMERIRYEPYGIAVQKEWLFARGGRPVIYQPESEFNLLPDSLRYRHVRYEPDKGVDFTWEREWRIETQELALDPNEALVVIPRGADAFNLMLDTATYEADSYDEDGVTGVYQRPKWVVLALDFFGFVEETSVGGG